ncbi:uncharacterized protein LOC143032210 [Oratosquilla oratoria]|uniref:uncharacterized protein LOC143032210 n=1 Tax=Oratosquilla oratoria TaxID=337810 RepID=UPI003F763793
MTCTLTRNTHHESVHMARKEKEEGKAKDILARAAGLLNTTAARSQQTQQNAHNSTIPISSSTFQNTSSQQSLTFTQNQQTGIAQNVPPQSYPGAIPSGGGGGGDGRSGAVPLPHPPGTHFSQQHQQPSQTTTTQSTAATPSSGDPSGGTLFTGGGFIPDDDNDFKSPAQGLRLPQNDPNGTGMSFTPDGSMIGPEEEGYFMGPPTEQPRVAPPRKLRTPKIFFGTRTHKQIAQIIKELKRTAYKDVRCTVLSSREHSCIHPEVSRMPNKQEGCRLLLDQGKVLLSTQTNPLRGLGCCFNHGAQRMKTHDQIANFGLQGAWDLEDLVAVGKRFKACPYFVARGLEQAANIVFCPYSYLIDPLTREALDINLRGQVVILDEAHNIEDSAREAASNSFAQHDILETKNELEKMAESKHKVRECREMAQLLSCLSSWMDGNSNNLTDYKEFDRSGKIWTGTEFIAVLNELGIGQERHQELREYLAILSEDTDPDDDRPHVSAGSLMLLKSIFLIYHYIFIDNMVHRDDYRVALIKEQIRRKPDAQGFKGRRKSSLDWNYTINFWCLNPGVAFREVKDVVRTIVLTSGTLSPMSSFQSELMVPFQIQLEANHVIDKKQVWVGTIAHGPTKQTLLGTYRHTETWDFQDELGRVVLDVCQNIARGVLCFLPSYAMLNKLVDRWQSTGLWDEILKTKMIMIEPRRSDDFEETMKLFYDTIRDTKPSGDSDKKKESQRGIKYEEYREEGEVYEEEEEEKKVDTSYTLNGALFMAVCRGKVSEGLDFTDDNARAVIAVGIPFPSVKDIQVDLKRQYNNNHCKTRGVLSGSEWYEIQAYRALNQALGRCLRHRYDWGALILIDERYQRGFYGQQQGPTKYTKGLSKWVRNCTAHYPNYSDAIRSLSSFAFTMTVNPPGEKEKIAKMNEEAPSVSHTGGTSVCEGVCGSMEKPSGPCKQEKLSPHAPTSTVPTSAPASLPNSSLPESHSTCSEFSLTIEGPEPNSDILDLLNTSGEDIYLPKSKLPFTSTQLSTSPSRDKSEPDPSTHKDVPPKEIGSRPYFSIRQKVKDLVSQNIAATQSQKLADMTNTSGILNISRDKSEPDPSTHRDVPPKEIGSRPYFSIRQKVEDLVSQNLGETQSQKLADVTNTSNILNISEGELQLPASRLPFAFNQLSTQPPTDRNTSIEETDASPHIFRFHKPKDVPSTQAICTTPTRKLADMASDYKALETSQPKRRKLEDTQSMGKKEEKCVLSHPQKPSETKGTGNHSEYKFQFVNPKKDLKVSPLKVLVEKEVEAINKQSVAKGLEESLEKQSCVSVPHTSDDTAFVDTAFLKANKETMCVSPELFNSDDETDVLSPSFSRPPAASTSPKLSSIFPLAARKKNSKSPKGSITSKGTKEPNPPKPMSSKNTFKDTKRPTPTKTKAVNTNKAREDRGSLSFHDTIIPESDDSDLEDFKLEKSFSTPKISTGKSSHQQGQTPSRTAESAEDSF